MGLEIVVLLVDVPSLRQLVTTPWSDLYSGLEKRTMRSIRPEQDSRLKVNFDIDAEAELLDWMDTQQRDSSETTSFWSCLQDSVDGEKGLLLAMKWASPELGKHGKEEPTCTSTLRSQQRLEVKKNSTVVKLGWGLPSTLEHSRARVC